MVARLKLQVATNGLVLAAACIGLGLLLLAGAGYVYATPGVEEQPPEQIDSFDIEVTLDDSAVVSESSPLYEQGDELRSQPVYFLNVTPEITFEATVDANDDREINITQELVLLERADRDGDSFWTRETVLAEDQTITTDGEHRMEATLNMRDLSVEQDEIASIIEAVSEPESELQLQTTYETESVAGESYEGTLSVSQTISFVPNAYWFEGDRTASDSEERFEDQPPVELSPNLLLVSLLTLFGLGLFVLSGVIVQQSDQYDPEELRIQVYSEEYAEWISDGELVVDPNKQYIYVNSLKDLVNIGIDADKRVIHDTELDAYVVVDSGLVYYYAREPTNIEMWANVGGTSNTGGGQS